MTNIAYSVNMLFAVSYINVNWNGLGFQTPYWTYNTIDIVRPGLARGKSHD